MVSRITERGLIGRFIMGLEAATGRSFVPDIFRTFRSDQFQEVIPWLGTPPGLSKWEGERSKSGIRENEVIILNEDYEASINFLRREVTQDKTGQIMSRVDELATRAADHWEELGSTLLINGESKTGYDGQFFFDTDHAEGESGTQSNDITYNVVDPANPTTAEMEAAIKKGIKQLLTLKDDRGKPMNSGARSFMIQVPVNLIDVAASAVGSPVIIDGGQSKTNLLATYGDWTVRIAANPRLDASWYNVGSASKIAIFRTDSPVRPFLAVQDAPEGSAGVRFTFLGEGSEYAKLNNKFLFGVEVTRGVGYGYWQLGCLVTLN